MDREFLRQLAAADAPAVLESARSAARERARAILEDALVDELLAAVRPSAPSTPDRDAPSAWWAYCVVGAERAAEVASGLTGVEPGSPVEAVTEGGLAALVSRVPLAEYGDEELRAHLEDIEWLEQTARAHEAVQEAVLDQETLVPLRLCTIYRDVDRIRGVLREKAEAFARNLTALAGAKEWGVKVFLDPGRVPSVSPADGVSSKPDSGTAYLASRQQDRDRTAQADELAEQCIEDVRRAISSLAIGERVNPVQSPEAHGREAEMIFNGASLVPDGRAAELQAALGGLQSVWTDRGLLVELTGPWPPYNFVSDAAATFS